METSIETQFTRKVSSITHEICSQLLPDCTNEIPKTVKDLESHHQQLHACTSRLIKSQKGFSLVREMLPKELFARQKAVNSLIDNLSSSDYVLHKIDVGMDEIGGNKGLGLVAKEEIQEGSLLLKIPLSCCIAEQHALESEVGKFFRANPLTSSMPNVTLALFLLHELAKGKASSWYLYLRSLPAEPSPMVLRVLPQHLAALRGTSVHESIVRLYRSICRHYCLLMNCFRAGRDPLENGSGLKFSRSFTFEDYRWAVAMVMSRNNPLPTLASDSPARQLALIPLFDMMNHKKGKFTCDFDDSARCVTFYAMESMPMGHPISMHYGDRSQSEFFLYSGFLQSQPESTNWVTVQLTLNRRDLLWTQKQEILTALQLDRQDSFKVMDSEEGHLQERLPLACLAFARVFVMTADEMQAFLLSNGDKSTWSRLLESTGSLLTHPLSGCSRELEIRALQYLQGRFILLERCVADCSHLDTSVQSADDVMDMCRQLAKQEKCIYARTKVLFEEMLRTLP